MSSKITRRLRAAILVPIVLAAGLRASAQADSVTLIRRFMTVCNAYKQLPVQVNVDMRRTCNLVLSKADTGEENASFFLCSKGSYITMGPVEQLANDSMVLLVNKPARRMILMANHQSVAARLAETLTLQMRDSTVEGLALKYLVAESASAGDTAGIRIRSRNPLYRTQLPREEILLRYQNVTKQPCEVISISRTLVPVEESVFRSAASRGEWAGRTLSFHDSSFYLIKEQQTVFRYRRVTHEQTGDLPVQVSDRIEAESPGRYRPVGSYADFVLSRQY